MRERLCFGGGSGEDDVAAAMLDGDVRAERRGQRFLESKRVLRGGQAERELDEARKSRAIDGNAGTIGPAVRQLLEHGGKVGAELRLEPRILEKQADNAAHDPLSLPVRSRTYRKPWANQSEEIEFPRKKRAWRTRLRALSVKRLRYALGIAGDDSQIGPARLVGFAAPLLPIAQRTDRNRVAGREFLLRE